MTTRSVSDPPTTFPALSNCTEIFKSRGAVVEMILRVVGFGGGGFGANWTVVGVASVVRLPAPLITSVVPSNFTFGAGGAGSPAAPLVLYATSGKDVTLFLWSDTPMR